MAELKKKKWYRKGMKQSNLDMFHVYTLQHDANFFFLYFLTQEAKHNNNLAQLHLLFSLLLA